MLFRSKLGEKDLDAVFARFKDLADRKKEIFDEDLEALVESELATAREFWKLASLHVSTGTSAIPTATVELLGDRGAKLCDASTGDGPVDAIFRAIERLTGVALKLEDYQLRAVTGGTEAQGEVRIQVRHNGSVIAGRGLSTDVLEASALAYVDATNRALARKARGKTAAKKRK